MRKLGVDGHSDELAADLAELLCLVIEGDDFSGADEGEVKGVEEEDHVFAVVGFEVDVDEVVFEPGGGHEEGSRFAQQRHILFIIKLIRDPHYLCLREILHLNEGLRLAWSVWMLMQGIEVSTMKDQQICICIQPHSQ